MAGLLPEGGSVVAASADVEGGVSVAGAAVVAATVDGELVATADVGEAAVVAAHAAELSVTPARWISLLVRRRIRLGARVDFGWRSLLVDIRRQLRGVARNLNQATRAVNAAMMEDSGLDLSREVGRLLDMRIEVAEQVGAMDAALLADYAYWQVPR